MSQIQCHYCRAGLSGVGRIMPFEHRLRRGWEGFEGSVIEITVLCI